MNELRWFNVKRQTDVVKTDNRSSRQAVDDFINCWCHSSSAKKKKVPKINKDQKKEEEKKIHLWFLIRSQQLLRVAVLLLWTVLTSRCVSSRPLNEFCPWISPDHREADTTERRMRDDINPSVRGDTVITARSGTRDGPRARKVSGQTDCRT